LQEKLFELINKKLDEKWLIFTQWTIMDATIIQAPSSTKNKDEERDPEMHSTKKGNQRYFWMKTHIGVDSKNWIVHTLLCTPANIHDSVVDENLQHWKEKEIYADSAYHSKEKEDRAIFSWKFFLVCRKWSKNKPLTQEDHARNRFCASTRCKVEHIFWVIKNTRWHRKVRYKWLHKNEMQRYMLCGLVNLYRMRSYLLQ
jgi:IS5 family transposase